LCGLCPVVCHDLVDVPNALVSKDINTEDCADHEAHVAMSAPDDIVRQHLFDTRESGAQ
jgi:hypothetical protein